MGDRSGISWCDSSLSLWFGCTQISPACDNCYAMAIAHRLKVAWNGPPRRAADSAWRKLPGYQRGARRFRARHGRDRRVFINHLSDFFDNQAPQQWRDEGCAQMEAAPDVICILVTKRPQNVAKMVPAHWLAGRWPKNVWLLVTGEDQREFDRRVAVLMMLKAVHGIAVAGVSMEPMLEAIDIATGVRTLDIAANILAHGMFSPGLEKVRALDWIILGGESGPRARRCDDELWFGDVIRMSALAGTAVYVKQRSEANHPKTYEEFDTFPSALRIREFPA